MKETIIDRINQLRKMMKEEGIGAVFIPTSDYHNSEYVGDYFKVREFFSGFTGSNGDLVVMENFAGLWTDGRYFVQAEQELEGTGIELFKMGNEGVPTITELLLDNMDEESCFAFDGRCISARSGSNFEKKLSVKNISIRYDIDPADGIWINRPGMSDKPIIFLDDKLSGESAASKLSKVREEYRANGAEGIIITKLDDIMWLLNLRGGDVECNPVALSNLYLNDKEAILFVALGKIDEFVSSKLSEYGVSVLQYDSFDQYIAQNILVGKIQVDIGNINYRLYKNLCGRCEIEQVDKPNPTEALKAIKNETELTNLREVYLKDSVALTRFICWLKNNIKTEDLTEYTAAKILDGMRAEIPEFMDLSFPTIGAYAENGAIVHYEPTKENAAKLKPEGMYLVDSGGQYYGGTTDVTRTIVLGDITDEMRKHYTLVAMGMLRLAATPFLEGCTGRNLDIIARKPLWEHEIDYKHGTGHGIGYILNVHEGPQNIRFKYIEGTNEAVLEPGMIVSDEPGIYITGSHGIRIENILEIVQGNTNEYGKFLGFEHLTYVPIDLEAIDISVMEKTDIQLLNEYHRNVFEKISPFITDKAELEWLKMSTREI